jgi:SAM-dependent methyltransferase
MRSRRAPCGFLPRDFIADIVQAYGIPGNGWYRHALCPRALTLAWCGAKVFRVNRVEPPGESGSGASDEVRDFYERLPYPAPLASLDAHRDLYADPLRRRALFHRIWPAERPGAHLEILVAGCGTSQAARYALREPHARVTAIDISETSLRHTGGLKAQYGLDNLELHQLPLESVKDLGRSFDLIVCTGVLHHLADPDLGLAALRETLRAKGAIHLMVYASYGRAGIYMLQEYCRMLRIGTSPDDLQDLGILLQALPRDHPLAGLLSRAKDFRKPDALADALLHPRDRAYTVPELYAWLKRSGLSFGRWIEQAPYLPQCGVLASNGHSERLDTLSAPEQHAAAELFRGTMTQHSVVAYRSDSSMAMQAFDCADERWRDAIPLRLPWTLCIRERLPPGSVAVLLNPAHAHRDLVLPINAAQDRVLARITGHTSLGAIVDASGPGGADQAIKFVQQLWWYDQIVFDASGIKRAKP